MEWVIRLVLSGILGACIGFEREKRLKEAGLRTHFLVAVGSAVIMIISKYGFTDVLGQNITLDPSRIAAQVVSGIGFLGAGTILVQRQSVRGLTTAAGLWATSGIGLAIGAGMYTVGIVCTALVLLGFELLNRVFKPVLPNKSYQLAIYATTNTLTSAIIDRLSGMNLVVSEYAVRIRETTSDSPYVIQVKMNNSEQEIDHNQITKSLQDLSGVKGIKFSAK
ncbi:MgtC/SapB family protein [Pullulanibacillus camelliae]|nr:MgtC/SapB family protein [Pullulanibacillus camelliae]